MTTPKDSELWGVMYLSRATVVVDDACIRSIQTDSVRQNSQNRVRGFLLACGQRFFQYLEGPREHVVQTLARIMLDPRHTDTDAFFNCAIPKLSTVKWTFGSVESLDDSGHGHSNTRLILCEHAMAHQGLHPKLKGALRRRMRELLVVSCEPDVVPVTRTLPASL